MGLDQYINVYDNQGDKQEVAYFRKVNWLHNWMHRLHCKKYGDIPAVNYNCVDTVLDVNDLLKLQKDVIEDNIQTVNGSFFGSQVIYLEDKEKVLEAVTKCLVHRINKNKVAYDSWW